MLPGASQLGRIGWIRKCRSTEKQFSVVSRQFSVRERRGAPFCSFSTGRVNGSHNAEASSYALIRDFLNEAALYQGIALAMPYARETRRALALRCCIKFKSCVRRRMRKLRCIFEPNLAERDCCGYTEPHDRMLQHSESAPPRIPSATLAH
jgi:hypothetical protein